MTDAEPSSPRSLTNTPLVPHSNPLGMTGTSSLGASLDDLDADADHETKLATGRISTNGSVATTVSDMAPTTATAPTVPRTGRSTRAERPHTPPHLLHRQSGVLGWLERATLHTVPHYFAITMGTGISSILLHNFPYPARWLQYLGTIVFALNVLAFVVILAFTIARYACWTGVWGVVLKHNVTSMFWGCFPMGLATIINMICFVCVPAWGKNWAYLALALWWTCVVLSVFINVGMVFVLFARQRQTAQTLGPTWLLPIVTTVVAAASGAVVAQTLLPYNAGLGRGTLLAAYCVWGTGVPLAMMVIALVVYRTAIYGPPEGSALASSFLPLGPCGQGSYGIIMMGTTARHLAYDFDTPIIPGLDADAARRIADAMYAGGLVVGLIMWGLALVFYLLASALFIDSWRRDWALLGRSRFAIGLWGLTFPIGVFATATLALATELHSPAFRVIGAFLAVQVIIHWLFVGIGTLIKAIDGSLFAAPELTGLDDSRAVRHRRSPSPPRVRMRRWTNVGEKPDLEAGLA